MASQNLFNNSRILQEERRATTHVIACILKTSDPVFNNKRILSVSLQESRRAIKTRNAIGLFVRLFQNDCLTALFRTHVRLIS